LAKGVLDALNKVVWDDDCKITCLFCNKMYGDSSGVIIIIDEVPDRFSIMFDLIKELFIDV
jgi:Holliday junction resolvase RusA-like endonuclease